VYILSNINGLGLEFEGLRIKGVSKGVLVDSTLHEHRIWMCFDAFIHPEKAVLFIFQTDPLGPACMYYGNVI